MDLAEVALLRGAEGDAVLARLGALTATELADPLPLLARLRAEGHDPVLAGAALTQTRLRVRARARLGPDAELMLFTPDGAEQATRRTVAEHRAARIAASGARVVADVCCGIGGDAVVLARSGLAVVAVERDPVTAAVARHNVKALGLSDTVTVHETDAESALRDGLLDSVDVAFIDPARRGGRGRVFDPDSYSPPFSFVRELAARVPATVAKVAPGIPRDLGGPGVETEWVSDAGEVKEAALWHGPLATGGVSRRATLLPSGVTVVDTEPERTEIGDPGRWLHEPDGAVVRAGLVGQIAATLDGQLLDASIAYVTTDADVTHAATHRYEVLASQPFGLKPLRATLRSLGFGDVVVKKRGSAIEPTELRRRLRLGGDGPTATVVVTRLRGRPWVLVTTPTT